MKKILDGRTRASVLASELEKKISRQKGKQSPLLIIFVCNPTDASRSYIAQKQTLSERVGIQCQIVALPRTTTSALKKLQSTISAKNPDGVILQLPLPAQLDAEVLCNAFPPEKDVDVLGAAAFGALVQGRPFFVPPIVQSVFDLLLQSQVSLLGANVVIVGSGVLVGKPVALALMNAGATVTVCNKFTKKLSHFTRQADVLISGVGKAHLVTGAMVKRGAIVLDAGFSRQRGKVVGDVEITTVLPRVRAISPVPGGIGPLTVYFLLLNVFQARNRSKAVSH